MEWTVDSGRVTRARGCRQYHSVHVRQSDLVHLTWYICTSDLYGCISVSSVPGPGASDTDRGRQGHLVDLPLEFLESEDLLPDIGTKEAMVPTYMWT